MSDSLKDIIKKLIEAEQKVLVKMECGFPDDYEIGWCNGSINAYENILNFIESAKNEKH
jgi:predicted GH43/DUF377 family glycosyl hydrolase